MNMSALDWGIVGVLLIVLTAAAVYTARYTKSVTAFLVANRCGRRYIITTANAMAGTGLISLIYWFELHYEVGFSGVWWSSMTEPALIIIALSGWVVYRFRQTRAMTLAQFFEMRYSRTFRVFAGLVAYLAGIVNFGIYPAVGARFFIAYCGLPETLGVGGLEVPTIAPLMAVLLAISLTFTFLGGQIAVMVTDFLQGAFANIVFIITIIFLLCLFRWEHMSEVLLSRPQDESLTHPFRIASGQDFNIWYFIIAVVIVFYTFNSWQGTQGYQCCAKDAHEAKMANVLYGWRFRVLLMVTVIVPIAIHTLLQHPDFAEQAAAVNQSLATIEAPTAEQAETLQNQLRTPYALAAILPVGLLGLLGAAMLAAFISTHDTYLHSWGSIFVQDVVLPFRRRPLGPRQHLWLLRLSILGVAVFIFIFSLVIKPTQFIAMFFAITAAVFVGGAGSAIIGGLYWKRGTAAGAWAAMITAMALSTIGLVAKQTDADFFIRNLDGSFWFAALGLYLKEVLTGQELTFWVMVLAAAAYVCGSLLTADPRIDMDKLLHRGRYAVAGESSPAPSRPHSWLERLGIDPEFTGWDRVVAAVSVGWPLLWTALFLVITAWNLVARWPDAWWLGFWKFWIPVVLVTAIAVTLWFTIGGCRDVAWLFRQLRRHRADPSDDGRLEHRDYQEVD
ncbi:MAG: sodium:solute symporter family protein [Planctomycetota bacterium]|jgi:SSS family solute:Na+ symporter